MKPTKPELRQSLKQVRLQMPAKEHQLLSQAIANRLKQAIDWSKVSTLHCFEPITSLNEVDISGFVTTLRSEYPNLKVYTPKRINNVWQIPDHEVDVIIVPMLGFDENLHRLGYGGGYYDRFLATQPQAQKIGVCFEAGKLNQIPVEPHDIPLDIIVTETQTYRS